MQEEHLFTPDSCALNKLLEGRGDLRRVDSVNSTLNVLIGRLLSPVYTPVCTGDSPQTEPSPQ